jgi:hypothetical protein
MNDDFGITDIDLMLDDQIDLDLDWGDFSGSVLVANGSGNGFHFAQSDARVNLDVENEKIEITYNDGRQTDITFQDLEKMTVLIDTLDQIGDSSELGRLFRTNMAMHKLRGND